MTIAPLSAYTPEYTPNRRLPYPSAEDSADVPRDVKALADALDAQGGAAGSLVLSQAPVLDVGMTGQVRAGRQLAAADFVSLGLAAPRGLWNLSDLSDASGAGRTLTDKGAVPFGPGVNGLPATCAVFAGSSAQALYVLDTGAADPLRIRTGTVGCWARSTKRGVQETLVSKLAAGGATAGACYQLMFNPTNQAAFWVGDGATLLSAGGVSDVHDGRWHFVVGTHDGTTIRLYVDGVLEGLTLAALLIQPGAAPLNVGAYGADSGAVAGAPMYGRVDEAFVLADVASEEQVRVLYCARLAHGLPVTPSRATLLVRRRRRGGALAAADFPAQPIRLHNFTAGALTDEGSGNVALTANPGSGAIVAVAGADGARDAAYSLGGAHTGLSATDAGLPAALTSRSYGCWFKTASAAGAQVIIGWGTLGTADTRCITSAGVLTAYSAGDTPITGPYIVDGQWHLVVVVEDNAAGDGVRRKLYLDGRLVGASTVLNAITLAGANRFRVGANPDGTAPFVGQVDGVFVTGVALTFEQVAALWAKGSQALAPSPKESGAHVEAFDATGILARFDTLDPQHTIDLGVGA